MGNDKEPTELPEDDIDTNHVPRLAPGRCIFTASGEPEGVMIADGSLDYAEKDEHVVVVITPKPATKERQ